METRVTKIRPAASLFRAFGLSLGMALTFLAPPSVSASEPFPARNVNLVVPTPAAGPLDFFARALAPELGKRWNVAVTVDNKPGAGTALGTQIVARAKPDGHTLLVANIAISAHAALSKAPLFDVEKELQPLSMIASTPYFLITPEKTGATLEELVAKAKAAPGKLNFGIIPNSQQHLDTALLLSSLGIRATLIPYSGAAPITRALLAGELDAYLGTLSGMQPHFDSGKLRPLAVTSDKPWPTLPGVPTLKSRGVALQLDPWYALFAPAGLPAPVLAKLREDLLAVMQNPAFEAKVRAGGYEPRTSSAAELGQMVSSNLRQSRELVRVHNIQPE